MIRTGQRLELSINRWRQSSESSGPIMTAPRTGVGVQLTDAETGERLLTGDTTDAEIGQLLIGGDATFTVTRSWVPVDKPPPLPAEHPDATSIELARLVRMEQGVKAFLKATRSDLPNQRKAEHRNGCLRLIAMLDSILAGTFP